VTAVTPPEPDRPVLPTLPTRHMTTARVLAVRGASSETRDDTLVGEEPLEIRAAGPGQNPVAVAVTMRTPGSEAELAVGFLRTEGLIGDGDVAGVEFGDPATLSQPDDTVIVRLHHAFDASVVAERHFVATASCGICGKASLDEIEVHCDPIPAGPIVDRAAIVGLPATLREAQRVFEATGGLHGAGIFEPDGRLVAVREDVGRHNALDKLVGWAVLAGHMPLNGKVLLVSGRVSLEIVQKAAVAGIPVVCAVSAPSDLAVEAAGRFGQTLIGFLRGEGFNVYTGSERLRL
jgi:FdhD protein